MKNLLIVSILFVSNVLFANEPFQLQTPLTTEFQTVLKLVRNNLNGWSKLNFDNHRTLCSSESKCKL